MQIQQIDKDIKFDDEQAPSKAAKARDLREFRISKNQVGISSVPIAAFSPSNEIRKKLLNLFRYHQFKGNQLITEKFLPRRYFVKPSARISQSMQPTESQASLQSLDIAKHKKVTLWETKMRDSVAALSKTSQSIFDECAVNHVNAASKWLHLK